MSGARLLSLIAALFTAGVTYAAPPAQSYPTRPIRLIVPFPAGGPTDAIARILGQKLTETWGQQVIVDNRVGAGGNIGMGIAAQAAPDGHTIIFVSSSFVANPSLYKKAPYDPYKSFAPVTKIAAAPHAFFVHPSQPVKTINELIDLVKKNPKRYNIATPGVGTTPDLSAHLLRLDTKVDLTPIPYAGGGPSLQAVLGNQVQVGCQAIPPVTVHFKAGRLRALALTSEKRIAVLPDVPTMAEAGYKGHEADTMTGVLLPARTPKAIVDKWYSESKRIVGQPDVNAKIAEMGFNIIVNTPQQFTAQIKEEVVRWGKVISAAGIPVN
ncbi:MAG TPA: tripartite tricarboxylate transporter substrate binding protein [Burkholderiales bacterium]|nr:tripartite tricarboxylate transporter substrate binding protein [Burkholderiales bacterium]